MHLNAVARRRQDRQSDGTNLRDLIEGHLVGAIVSLLVTVAAGVAVAYLTHAIGSTPPTTVPSLSAGFTIEDDINQGVWALSRPAPRLFPAREATA